MTKHPPERLTKDQARAICEVHQIFDILNLEHEVELLRRHDPELLEAYYALHRLAAGAPEDGPSDAQHTEHCVKRQRYGDGECECDAAGAPSTVERHLVRVWDYGEQSEALTSRPAATRVWVEISHELRGAGHYAELIGEVIEAETLRAARGQALLRAWQCREDARICAEEGHDFGSGPFAPAYCLHFCRRCGAELLGRPITATDELAPMPDDVRELFDRLRDDEEEPTT